MNDYGMSPLSVFQLMAPAMIIVPVLLWLLVIGPLLVYPLARWKAHREQSVDSQLGMKVALHYFKMLGFQFLLIGATVLVWTVIAKGSNKGDLYRTAFGFLVPGGLVFGAHLAFLHRTNDDEQPGVRRLFLGYNLIVTGIIGFCVLVLACQALFAKGSTGNEGRLFFASTIVYVGAWAACGIQFARLVLGDWGASAGGPPAQFASPPAPPQAGQAGSGGAGLPSLGGGAYPPIEPQG